ncbi:uncharacterized protein MONOS_17628 [Monocercomonoides exilis]|uniref:uncharacterized protein n=1 Tax=Monocercomonoides exilis TaxID=2049356 RepID=UPI003559D3D4|nr:hypothetical protein MONOS_17628 [Monocercomonoides exilis]
MFLKLVFLQVVLSIYSEEGKVEEMFVKSKASSGGDGTEGNPMDSIKGAYDKLNGDTSSSSYIITIIKQENNTPALVAGVNEFDKNVSLMIQGKQSGNGTPELVEINCTSTEENGDTGSSKDLFTCKQNVTFKYLKFIYPMSLGTASNDGNTLAIIHLVANSEESISGSSDLLSTTTNSDNLSPNLTISTCQFARPAGTANIHLVKVEAGEFNMEAVFQ